jgi:hypothetical protein
VDLSDPARRAALVRRLEAPYAGRPVVVFAGVLAAATPTVARLRDAGAGPLLVLCTARGAGPVPAAGECEVVELAVPAFRSVTHEMRAHDRLLRHLPGPVAARVEALDPAGEGVWLVGPFVTSDEPVLGRPVRGGRPAAFLALEDKLLAEQVWAELDVERAPHRVVPAEAAALAEATAALAGPLGAVWSGDSRGGFNGGGDFVRWVRDEDDARRALAFFVQHCDRVRVLPFLDGIPCSVHGMVLPDGTAAFRPVEIAALRDPATRRFVYGGPGTTWDPPEPDRAAMRALARRVGDHLATTRGYRGAFGVDGVLTAAGFRPTELNSRFSAGLTTLARGVDLRLFQGLQEALLAGEDPGVAAPELEALVPLMDAQRTATVATFVEGASVGQSLSHHLAWDGRDFHRSDRETPNLFVAGDTPSGCFARIDPCEVPVAGQRLAPVLAALTRYLDRDLGTSLGPLESAPDLR